MQSTIKDIEIRGAVLRSKPMPWLQIAGFVVVCLLPFAIAWSLTKAVASLVWTEDSFSQILVIPFVSLFFIYEGRRKIFAEISFAWVPGVALIVLALPSLFAARMDAGSIRPTNQGALFVFGALMVWLGAFYLFFGTHAFQAARFPLLFMFFCVPIPEPVLSRIIAFLQVQSANAAAAFFQLTGVPYLREGLVFRLPGVAIRVAEECSGIRSSLALMITTVLASYLYLRTTWKRLLLCAVVVPLAILKNGLRIATLSILAIYVNPGFLFGKLHHRGGIVFFMAALVPMGLLLIWLQKTELRRTTTTN